MTPSDNGPWDSLVSISPSISYPKLLPESDNGNIEYKLQLISPTPSRFARLVTQLKWRLLEGHGQAYYELGVSDSGVLIGLSQLELSQTLLTLEEMAGEIGATVIVVKEVQVPEGMKAVGMGIDESKGDYCVTDTRRRRRKTNKNHVASHPHHEEFIDNTSNYEDLSLFSMDPEPEYDSDTDAPSGDDADAETSFSIDLQISTVYKPRPARKRVHVALKGKSKKDTVNASTINRRAGRKKEEEEDDTPTIDKLTLEDDEDDVVPIPRLIVEALVVKKGSLEYTLEA